MTTRILLVEDEPGLVLTLSDRLAKEGYAVETAADGETGLERAATESFDLIILDVMLPNKNGFDVCRDLRQKGLQKPILMLTYLTKPFDMMELLARIEALLRRVPTGDGAPAEIYRFGTVEVDFRRAEVSREGNPVELSALELKLLRYFIEHRGATLSRDELLNEVWGYEAMPHSRTVDVHVSWLRQKLETNPSHPEFILTVHGLGYKFVG
jgi:two-component system alkaline phosphatase synthesis response regulator PhoP